MKSMKNEHYINYFNLWGECRKCLLKSSRVMAGEMCVCVSEDYYLTRRKKRVVLRDLNGVFEGECGEIDDKI